MKKVVTNGFCSIFLFAGLSMPAAAAPVFAGSDDFDAGYTPNWAYAFRVEGSGTGNGALSFTNDRLDFSKGAGAGSYFLGWDGVPGPANGVRSADSAQESWVMDLEVTNNLLGLGAGEFANVGFQVGYDNLNFYTIFLSNSAGGSNFRVESSGRDLITSAPAAGTEDIMLRIIWDANSQTLASGFSYDGGSLFTILDSGFAPGDVLNWGMAPTNGFYYEVFSNTNAANSIGIGSIYADNFSITASVPAPATLGLLAIALLGMFGNARRHKVPA